MAWWIWENGFDNPGTTLGFRSWDLPAASRKVCALRQTKAPVSCLVSLRRTKQRTSGVKANPFLVCWCAQSSPTHAIAPLGRSIRLAREIIGRSVVKTLAKSASKLLSRPPMGQLRHFQIENQRSGLLSAKVICTAEEETVWMTKTNGLVLVRVPPCRAGGGRKVLFMLNPSRTSRQIKMVSHLVWFKTA